MFVEKTYQGSLFDDCATKCEAYGVCGGRRNTAPCGCVWTHASGLRYKCHKCYLICRERREYNTDTCLQLTSFETNVENGLSLDQVRVNQAKCRLPIYIPVTTNNYHGSIKFSGYVAVDARMLFNHPRSKAAVLKSQFETEDALRQYLRVTKNCKLIAVLNGTDKMLERMWAMPRTEMLAKLASIGFSICTGPTFSLTALTPEGTVVPFSHHNIMLMRHHRVLSEISDAGLCAIPNLYWLDGDTRQLNQWAVWLKESTNVFIISKDFTSTRNWSAIQPKLSELIELLKQVGRPFHVLIIGTGQSNAPRIVRALSQAGHSISIVTSAPILKAIHGSQYITSFDGKLSDAPSDKSKYSFDDLIKYNLDVFEKKLESSVA
jgi:hypothetical protein